MPLRLKGNSEGTTVTQPSAQSPAAVSPSSSASVTPITVVPQMSSSSPVAAPSSSNSSIPLNRQVEKPKRVNVQTRIAPTVMLVPPPPNRPPFNVTHYKDFFALCHNCGSQSDDDSGNCPACLKPIDILPLCTVCGRHSNDVAEDLNTP